jgi:C4-dicarboxylate-specific signal transduction histidine kinase
MTVQWETVALEGFHFFGKMSASISHEIKNTLAIINEKAGLLEDFTVLAEQGRPIDPERLKSLAKGIMAQIQRADGLVKRMNQFAHSSDDPLIMIDLGETLELITAIAQRLASMRQAQVDLRLPDHPLLVVTNPFLFENLIWSCLEFLLTENHKIIRLIPESIGEDVRIRLIGQFAFPDGPGRSFPAGREETLLTLLKAELRMEPNSGEMILLVRK